MVTLMPADFATLRTGAAVAKLSTTGGGHTHTYTINCAN
jgi:hypothetical protein